MLVGSSGEDVAIDVGVRITDEGAVGLSDLMVVVQVSKMHVTGSEIMAVHTIIGKHKETGSLCLLRGGEDTERLISIELIGRLSHLSTDSSTVDGVVHILTAVGEFGNLVLIMTHAGTHLPLEVFQCKQLHSSCDIEAVVFQLSTIRPVLVQTGQESKRLACEKIVSSGTEIIGGQTETVVKETCLNADIEALGGLPLDLIVSDT